MNKIQTPQYNISTPNIYSFKVLSNFISNVLTKTKEQESITNNSEIKVATNLATNIFDQTTGNIGTSKEYFSNVINIFRTIYKEPIISTTDTSSGSYTNKVSEVENKSMKKEDNSNKEVESDLNDPLKELTDCINYPENCI